jgi:hypothetical protein
MYKKIKGKTYELLKCLDNKPKLGIGLLSGAVGCSLFQFIFYELSGNLQNYKRGIAIIEDVFKEIEHEKNPINTFCSGLAGVGWFVEYAVEHEWIKDNTNEILDDLDKFLSHFLKIHLIQNNWDFLHGGIGLGIYFLRRNLKNDGQTNEIEYILNFLETTCTKIEKDKIGWLSLINYETKEKGYNISLSHGMSSVVIFLTKVYSQHLFKNRVLKLLNGAVNFILDQEMDINQYGSFFPSYSIECSKKLYKSRMAWCYGDLGIAMSLYQAGIAIQREDWIQKAIKILLYAAENRKKLQNEFIVDAGLCHGTAGIGHIFYRMLWNTHLLEFKEAADYWFNETLKMAKFKDSLAGYKSFQGKDGWVNSYGLLEGISGIGLALLTYTYNLEPTWDECLLLS